MTVRNPHWKVYGKALFGLALFFTLILVTDIGQMVTSVKSARLELLLASLMIFVVQGVFEGFRLSIVFSSYNITPTEGFKLFLVGLFFSNFMPGMIGADVYQVQQMLARRAGLLKPVGLMLFLRLSGLAINGLLAIAALLLSETVQLETLILSIDEHPYLRWIGYAFVGFSVLLLVLNLSIRIRSLLRNMSQKVAVVLSEVGSAVRSLGARQHLSIVLLGILVVFLRALSLMLMVWAFGYGLSVADAMIVVTVTLFISAIPISIAGLGVREVSRTAFLVLFGLSAPSAVAVAILGRFLTWILSAAGGIWFALEPPRKLTEAPTKAHSE